MPRRILLADDQTITRQGLRALFETEPAFEVVGEAANGREAIERANELQPEVVVMEPAMPEVNGIDATRTLVEGGFRGKVIMLR